MASAALNRLAARVLARPRPEIEVDAGTASILDDLVVRELELRGREVTPGDLLDDAIRRFLRYEAAT